MNEIYIKVWGRGGVGKSTVVGALTELLENFQIPVEVVEHQGRENTHINKGYEDLGLLRNTKVYIEEYV